jgi:hypothetical protein
MMDIRATYTTCKKYWTVLTKIYGRQSFVAYLSFLVRKVRSVNENDRSELYTVYRYRIGVRRSSATVQIVGLEQCTEASWVR